MLPINRTDPANEDVIISASESELYRSLHNIALQLRLSEWRIVEVLCDCELHRNATHGVHICTSGHGIILMQFENISSLLLLNIWTGIVGNIGMGPCYLSGQLVSGAMIFREVFYHNDLKVCP
jgi:hypothetical protein